MKKSLIFMLVASSILAAACGDKTAEVPATGAKPAVAAKATGAGNPDEKPRLATYDPNLKPAEIVWDSPEKKKAWEARQAELKKANAVQK
jgi:hypothetical protein